MDIFILAGKQTPKIITILDRYGFRLRGSDDLSEGLEQLTLNVQSDQLVMFDDCIIKDGRLLDYTEIFCTLNEFMPVNSDMEILFITKSKDIFDKFQECVISNSNARCELVNQLNGRILLECIKGTYSEKAVEAELEDSSIQIGSIIEEETAVEVAPLQDPEPIPVPKPEPIPEPKPEPVKKEKREKFFTRSTETNLNKLILKRKIIVVTGNPNSGVTSTFCAMSDVLQKDGVDTIMVDLDIYCKGVNMYFNHLDGGCPPLAKSGLSSALDDFDLIDEAIFEVRHKLALIGTASSISKQFIMNVENQKEEFCDLINILANDFKVVIIHCPIDLLLDNKELVKTADDIVYCSNGTINGISNIDRYINSLNTADKQVSNMLKMLQRKLKYVLTNYLPNTIKPNEWLKYLLEYTKENSLHQYVLGTIEHQPKFDNFDDCKELITSDRKQQHNIHDILENLCKF